MKTVATVVLRRPVLSYWTVFALGALGIFIGDATRLSWLVGAGALATLLCLSGGIVWFVWRAFHPHSWSAHYRREVAGKVWTRALLAWVESEGSIARPRGPATLREAVETAAGLYALQAVLVTGRTGPLRTPAVAAFGCHTLEVVLMLVRGEGIDSDPDQAAACFFHFMATGMPPAEAAAFMDEACTAWERLRQAAETGDDNLREWRSDLFTAVSGHLLSGIEDLPNLRATNWKVLFADLCTRLLNDFGDAYAR
jgi:hypothetical protein